MPRPIPTAEIARRQAIGRRILQAMASAEVTQAVLAQKLSIDQSTVSRFLVGTRRSERFLAQIAALTGVSAAWLRTGEGAPMPAASPPHRGRRPSGEVAVRRLDAREWSTVTGRTAEAWALPAVLAQRVLDSTVRAQGLRTRATWRSDVYLVIAPTR